MVGTLMLLKMLHCRRARRRDKNSKERYSGDEESNRKSTADISVKADGTETPMCRVCLKEGIIPIYGSAEDNKEADLSDALRTIGGIYIFADDEYPKHLCQSCHELLQGAILLRKTARQSEDKLRLHCEVEPKPNYSASDDDKKIESDDDKKLESDDDNSNNDNNFTDNDDHKEDVTPPVKYKREKVVMQEVYKCKPCNLEFGTYEEYSEHRISEEHENMKHTCPICNKTYTNINFKRHLALHEKTYICDVCGKGFIAPNFNRHRVTHFYDLPFQCSLCPYKGRFKESLKLHMRSHTGEKPYHCTMCPSKFITRSNLNKHMFTHSGTHDFKCEDCGRGFYTKKSLELHLKEDHTSIKAHVCSTCGKAFGSRKQMMKHSRKVHKREKLRCGRLPLYLQVQAREAKEMAED